MMPSTRTRRASRRKSTSPSIPRLRNNSKRSMLCLTTVVPPWLGYDFRADPLAVPAKLCRRIERHIKELFVFVAEPDVPSDNNAAERSLRHLVISGGTRSEQGTESKMTLASISAPGAPKV